MCVSSSSCSSELKRFVSVLVLVQVTETITGGHDLLGDPDEFHSQPHHVQGRHFVTNSRFQFQGGRIGSRCHPRVLEKVTQHQFLSWTILQNNSPCPMTVHDQLPASLTTSSH